MSGTQAGGLKARQTNYETHGNDFYKRIGAIGGRNGHTGGFASNPELAKKAGAKGGKISKRGRKRMSNKQPEKIDLKKAFAEYAKKELEFYKTADRNKLYNRVLPNLKDKDMGTIEFFYNGIVVGGSIYKNTITLNKLRVTKVGKEEDIPEAVKVVEDKIKEVDMTCDNQLK